jgi:outer membrane receptor protein involved in Fe transport
VYENSWLTLGAFYNYKGETYVAGESWSGSKGYLPNIVEMPVGTLDCSLGLKFAKVWRLGFEAKNLLDPVIRTVYKGPMGELPNTTYKLGQTYSVSLSCSF